MVMATLLNLSLAGYEARLMMVIPSCFHLSLFSILCSEVTGIVEAKPCGGGGQMRAEGRNHDKPAGTEASNSASRLVLHAFCLRVHTFELPSARCSARNLEQLLRVGKK